MELTKLEVEILLRAMAHQEQEANKVEMGMSQEFRDLETKLKNYHDK